MPAKAKPTMYFSTRGVVRGMVKLFTISLFIVPLGIAFGVSATEKGMSALQATTMSVFVFSAAAQFATIDLFSSASPASILIVAFAVSTRLILLSASLSPWLNQLSRPRRLTTLTTLSDANFADSFIAFQREEKDIGRLFGGGLAIWLAWVIGTIIGGVVGQSFGDLNRFGIDVLMASLFSALILAQWRSEWQGKNTFVPALSAAIVAAIGLYVLPAGWNIVAAALAGGLAGALMHGR